MGGHRVLVMRDDDASLSGSELQYFGVRDAIKLRGKGALEIDGRFTAQHTAADRTAKIVIRLESGLHLLRMRRVKMFPCGVQAFAQSCGQRGSVAAGRLETL